MARLVPRLKGPAIVAYGVSIPVDRHRIARLCSFSLAHPQVLAGQRIGQVMGEEVPNGQRQEAWQVFGRDVSEP